MGSFSSLLGDIASQAGGFIERRIEEDYAQRSALRGKKREFEALEPLQRTSALETTREQYGLKREMEAPIRRQYGEVLGPILTQAGMVPGPERAETEAVPSYLQDLDPDLAKTMLNYLAAKERSEQSDLFKLMGLDIAERRLALQQERTPPPGLERDLEAEAVRQGIAPEKRFEWKQGERARAAGQKAGATTTGKGEAERALTPVPSAAERGTLATAETSLQLLDKIEQQFGQGEFVGPVRGRYGAVGEVIPGLIGQPEAEFRANLSTLRNQMIKQITGAALSEPEAQRIMKQLPSEELPPDVFRARLKATRENAAYLDRVTRERFQRPAGDVGRIGKPAPKRFSSPAAVRSAMQAGKITSEQAEAILRQDFGFSD